MIRSSASRRQYHYTPWNSSSNQKIRRLVRGLILLSVACLALVVFSVQIVLSSHLKVKELSQKLVPAHEPPTEDELVHKLEEDKQRLFEETFLLKAEIESYKRSAGHVQYSGNSFESLSSETVRRSRRCPGSTEASSWWG